MADPGKNLHAEPDPGGNRGAKGNFFSCFHVSDDSEELFKKGHAQPFPREVGGGAREAGRAGRIRMEPLPFGCCLKITKSDNQ